MSKKKFVANVGYRGAAKYLHAIQDLELQEYFSVFTGGTFKADEIREWKEDPHLSGLMFWFCMDNLGGIKRKLYLAVEPKYNFSYPKELADFEKVRWEPKLKTLPIPGQFFGETIFNTSEDEMNEFLQKHKKVKFKKNGTKENVEVIQDVNNFKGDPLLSKFQKYPFAYFTSKENEDNYFDNFFNSGDVKYIRYYLGFDECYFPNKLRLILVPVGEGGENIVNENILSDYLLQKSWPPPPET
tara:strand:- start:6368 stop:7093 length:726 start_codon:yes stop_codon:yes gene_type:complete